MGEIHTAAQLMAAGLSRGTITYRTKKGQLHRVLPAVYSDAKPDYLAKCTAVTVWKPDAVLSHRSAAWLWGLLDREPEQVEVTVPLSAQIRGPDWVRIHRRTLTATATHRGLPVVTMAQTFIDVATCLDAPELEALFDRAVDLRVPWRAIARRCDEAPGMHGIPAVREQLRKCCPRTLSEPERLVARALTARNFYLEINARVGRYYGDLVDFRARVIVEIDGREFHTEPQAFNNDRRRQNALVQGGWLVLRYSAATASANLDEVVDEVIRVVRRRRRSVNAPTSLHKTRRD